MQTLIKIVFNRKFQMFEVLTCTANKNGLKITKFGNDFNIHSQTVEGCAYKLNEAINKGLIDHNNTMV